MLTFILTKRLFKKNPTCWLCRFVLFLVHISINGLFRSLKKSEKHELKSLI